ncbi:unnamed protein product [Paramecium sonneborni]|uniref:Uncharacterized protein n=1 Tax=Paramecium sonneborni TaxID=65129 RepID=A0A8S1M5D2_9CILI|nr:unnamed protein product [Paramecium sonneborni]
MIRIDLKEAQGNLRGLKQERNWRRLQIDIFNLIKGCVF